MKMSQTPPIIQLPRVSKHWDKKVTSHDVPPTPFPALSSKCTNSNENPFMLPSSNPFLSDQNKTDNNESKCSTCELHKARYTCPRCQAPYCSVACYRKHNKMTSSSSSLCTEGFFKDRVYDMLRNETKDPDNIKTMTQILQRTRYLESPSQPKQTQKQGLDENIAIIDKAENIDDGRVSSSCVEESNMTYFENEELEQEFMDLAYHVLQLNLEPNNSKISTEQDEKTSNIMNMTIKKDCDISKQTEELLFQSLQSKPHLLKYFEDAIANGELSHLIPTWDPWWMPNKIPSHHTNDIRQHNQKEPQIAKKQYLLKRKTLDEKMLAIPKFHTLLSPRQQKEYRSLNDNHTGNDMKSIPFKLQFNALHLLYTIVQTLRLYNGFHYSTLKSDNDNDSDEDNCYEMALTLFSISSVLNQDARYRCVEEVFMNCVIESTREYEIMMKSNGNGYGNTNKKTNNRDGVKNNPTTGRYCNTPWHVLTLDVFYLVRNKRFVCKALLTAKDFIQKGIQILQKEVKKMEKIQGEKICDNENFDGEFVNAEIDEQDLKQSQLNLKKLRLAKKKLVYYTSWCIAFWSNLRLEESLSREVQDWMDYWKVHDHADSSFNARHFHDESKIKKKNDEKVSSNGT